MNQRKADFVIAEVLHCVRDILIDEEGPAETAYLIKRIRSKVQDEYKYILRGPIKEKK